MMSTDDNGDHERGQILTLLARIESTLKGYEEEHRALSRRVGRLESRVDLAEANQTMALSEIRGLVQRFGGVDEKVTKLYEYAIQGRDADATQNTKIAELDKTTAVMSVKQKIAYALLAAGAGGGSGVLAEWIRSVLSASGKQ